MKLFRISGIIQLFLVAACLSTPAPLLAQANDQSSKAGQEATEVRAKMKPASEKSAPTGSIAQGDPRSLTLNEQGIAALNKSDFRKAEDLFKQSLDTDPGNLTAAFNLAGVYLVNEKKDRALTLLEDYTKRYPTDAGLFDRLGDIYFSERRFTEAISTFEKALKLEPNYRRLNAKIGLSQVMNKDLVNAEKSYKIATERSPNDSELLSDYANVLLMNGKGALALPAAKRAVELEPSARNYATLGSAYELNKEPKAALDAFLKAKELGNNDAELKEKIATLKDVVDR